MPKKTHISINEQFELTNIIINKKKLNLENPKKIFQKIALAT